MNKEDTIIFNIDASLHPFYIKTKFSLVSGNQVITGKLTDTLGTQSGQLSWNRTGVSSGKYYYVCSPNAIFGMGGSIIVE